jgi:hypothetical protein
MIKIFPSYFILIFAPAERLFKELLGYAHLLNLVSCFCYPMLTPFALLFCLKIGVRHLENNSSRGLMQIKGCFEKEEKKDNWWISKVIIYMIIPSMALVIDDSSTKASCWVDTSASDGDSCQVNKENCEPNWKGCKDLHSFRNQIMSLVST